MQGKRALITIYWGKYMRVSQKLGYTFGSNKYNEGYSFVGVCLGAPYLWKLPYEYCAAVHIEISVPGVGG